MRCLNAIVFILVVIGAINWGLWGFFQFDLVAWLFHGNTGAMSRIVYGIIGLAGVWSIGFLCKCCKRSCGGGCNCGCSCCSTKKDCSTGKDHKGGGCCK